MQALVLTQYDHLEIQDVPEPVPGPADVLVAVRACGICGSDVHGMDGSTGRRRPPLVMGHEAAGVVVRTGAPSEPGVSDWKPGDRVAMDSMVSCGRCGFCRSGRINLCDRRQVLGVSCDEYRRDGAFAQLVAVPGSILVRLPEAVGFRQAAMVEPLSVAVHAVGRARVDLNDSAVVVGAGMIGLLVVQVLRAAGCGKILAADVDPARLDLACKLGADEAIRCDQVDLPAAVFRSTSGRGADLAVEAVGIAPTVAAAIAAVRKGGRVTLVGNLAPQVALPLQAVVTRELTLSGSCASSGEYPACLDLLARGVVQVDPLLSAAAPLAQGPDWFRRLRQKEPGLLKVVLEP
ncbi:MAG: galactitol-1-phosphate 5-dehydrogenase [Thermoguttaceae bacterium]